MKIKDLRKLWIQETNYIYHRAFFSGKHVEMYNSYDVWKEKKFLEDGRKEAINSTAINQSWF